MHLSDGEIDHATRMNTLEWAQIHLGIEAEAVVTATTLNTQAQGGDFGIAHIDSGSIATRMGTHATLLEQMNDGLFHGGG